MGPGAEPSDAGKGFKFFKSMKYLQFLGKNLNFLIKLMENLPFSIIFQFPRIFRENLGKNLEIRICLGFEGWSSGS